jgi:hypothetical protein
MRRPITIIFLLTLFNSSFGQTDTIKFKQFGDSSEFSELNLIPNKTFEFHHYNMRSCHTWYSAYGEWKVDNKKLVFTDTIHWEEDILRIDTSTNNYSDYVLLTVKNDHGRPLVGVKIRYVLMWANSNHTYVTDERGQIKIRKNLSAKQRQKGNSNNNVRFAISFSNKKSSEYSMSTSFATAYDKIDITIVENPKEELIIRRTTYRIDGNEMYFESQTYTGDKGYGVQNWGNFRTIADK